MEKKKWKKKKRKKKKVETKELLTWPHVSLHATAWLASWRNTVTSLNGFNNIVLHNYIQKKHWHIEHSWEKVNSKRITSKQVQMTQIGSAFKLPGLSVKSNSQKTIWQRFIFMVPTFQFPWFGVLSRPQVELLFMYWLNIILHSITVQQHSMCLGLSIICSMHLD